MEENLSKQQKKIKFEMPHTFVLLSIVLILVSLLAKVIPAGEFERVQDAVTEKMVVIPGSYHAVESAKISIFDIFISVQRGFIESADIIFFIIFAYGFVFVLIKNGTLDAALGVLLRKLGDKIELIIPVSMFAFGILGATIGMYEEVYGLIPVFIGIAVALGYDAIVGGAIVVLGVVTGFAAAITNPFTLGIAQGIAGVPLFSGMTFRIICFIVFEGVAVIYTMRYAKKIKADPTKSHLYGTKVELVHESNTEDLAKMKFTKRHLMCSIIFIATIGILMYGTIKLGWYINEIAGLFLMMMIIAGKVGGFTFDEIAETFVEAAKTVTFGILAIGISRAISLILSDAKIADTIVNYAITSLSGASKYVAAVGMVMIQNFINFFVTSGSAQAAITMPITAPIAELLGLSKQIAVLAFTFGDGFSNLFWPTAVATECGLMGIAVNRWYKFMAPLFLWMLGLQVLFMIIAVAINYA